MSTDAGIAFPRQAQLALRHADSTAHAARVLLAKVAAAQVASGNWPGATLHES